MKKWKEEIYAHYSTNFGREINDNLYDQYIPFGKRIIETCFPSDNNIHILDLGCGKGGFIKVFLDAKYSNVTGVDVSSEEVEIANRFGILQAVQSDLMDWLKNAENQSYDLVLLLDVIEHFEREEALTILKEVHRVLKNNGGLILHVPNAEGIFGSRIRYSDVTHEQAFTFTSLCQISRHIGFTQFQCFEDKPIIHNLTSFIRRCIWDTFTLPIRLLFAAESGNFNVKLSQNILFKATK